MNRRPSTLAEVAERRQAREDFGRLLSEFLDQFYQALASGGAQAMIAMEPAALDDAREHALLGAAGEHLARRWKLSIPEWTNDPSRFLRQSYLTTPAQGLNALLLVESPLAFRRRLIFTEAEPLRRARMPVAETSDGAAGQTAAHAAYWQPNLALKWIGFTQTTPCIFTGRRPAKPAKLFSSIWEEFGCGVNELQAAYTGILKDAQKGAFADGRSARECRAERFGKLLIMLSIIPHRHLEAVLDLYDEALSLNLKLKEGAKETLLAARANGLRIMVVSEGPHDAQEATLVRLELHPLPICL